MIRLQPKEMFRQSPVLRETEKNSAIASSAQMFPPAADPSDPLGSPGSTVLGGLSVLLARNSSLVQADESHDLAIEFLHGWTIEISSYRCHLLNIA